MELLLSGFAAGLLAAEFELQPAAAIVALLARPGSDPAGPERGLAMAAIAWATLLPLVFVVCSIAARGLESSRMGCAAARLAPASMTLGAR